MFERLFALKKYHTTIQTEILAGFSTFLTMSYIIFVNPTILSAAGMDQGSVFVATCLAAALGSAMMGIIANYPIALAPGMALNTYFTYGVVLGKHVSWQTALGTVFISGVIFFLLSVLPIREYIINSIPKSLKLAIVAGIGLFLGIIGLKSAGIVISHPATLVTLGHLHQPTTLLAILGFFIIVGLDAIGFKAAILAGILSIWALSVSLGYAKFNGFFSLPPSLMPTFLQLNLKDALNINLLPIIFAFLFVDFFDNTGTLIGVLHRAGLMDKHNKLPRLNRVLIADSSAAIASALVGTSTTTSYLESTVGVNVGGRTGLTALVVAGLFLIVLLLSPIANSIPIFASAPALIYVACLMTRAFTEFNWDDSTEYTPAIITTMSMPFTFSIADGIAFGFISYVAIKIVSNRLTDLNFGVCLLAFLFILKYVFIGN